MKKEAAIVHFNTPEMTEAAVLSLRRHGGKNYHVTILDNSDKRPFTVKMDDVDVIDNTKGQIINFEKELAKFPDRSVEMGNVFGSAKHMMSVQWLMDNVLTEQFVLLDSDVLIKAPIDVMWMPGRAACGRVQTWQVSNNPAQIDRFLPMLLYLDVQLLKKGGAKFYDPERCFALQAGGRENMNNWWDTGAALLADIRTHREGMSGCNLSREIYLSMFDHYQKASWHKTDLKAQMEWLNQRRNLWAADTTYPLGPVEGKAKGLKIYICTHKDFAPVVKHPAYEVVDVRKDGDEHNGLRGSFYSEILTYLRIAQKKTLPKMVGFCGWRKYFAWMSNVPEIEQPIVSRSKDVGKPVREHYQLFANVKDLDLCTDIIEELYPDFAPSWKAQLESHTLHPFSMFVMPSKDFRRMMKLVVSVLDEFVNRAGDIDARIEAGKDGYHVTSVGKAYAYRIGGQLGERMISAWIDWQLPDAKEVDVKITSKP